MKEGLLQRILERKKRYCRCQKGIICFPCMVFNKDLAEINKTYAKIEEIMNPNANCKCGWKGTEYDLIMDEVIGCHPEVVLALQKVLNLLDSKRKVMPDG